MRSGSRYSLARFSLRTRPHKKSRCEHVSFFYGFYVKSSSRYSLVHILATSSSESAPKATVFWRFLSETDLSLQSRAHVANPIFQKSSERDSFSNANRACALFVDNFCRSRSAPAETKTPLRRPRVLPEKTEGSRPRIFSSLNLRVPELLHFRWWCGWHYIYNILCGCYDRCSILYALFVSMWIVPNPGICIYVDCSESWKWYVLFVWSRLTWSWTNEPNGATNK